MTSDQANQEQREAANTVTQAQLELLRVRAIRAELASSDDLTFDNVKLLQRLAALDRYERFAHTKRRRAAREL